MISPLPLFAHQLLFAVTRVARGTQSMIRAAIFRHGFCRECGQNVCDRCEWCIDVAIVGGLLPTGLWGRESAGVC